MLDLSLAMMPALAIDVLAIFKELLRQGQFHFKTNDKFAV